MKINDISRFNLFFREHIEYRISRFILFPYNSKTEKAGIKPNLRFS